MDNLIKALTIFRKYGNPEWPTHCEHDELFIMIDPVLVSDEDKEALEVLSFSPSDGEPTFYSFKYGSA